MPANKNALIRYKTIDSCLRNRYRRYTLDDLVEACSDALYEMEGISKGVSLRTVQGDIQIMRSDKLGYNAPIEVYDHKYYRYEDPDYSITNMPLTQNDYEVMTEAVDMLRQLGDFEQFAEISDAIGRLQDKLSIAKYNRRPLIHFDSVPDLKGLKYLNPLYNYIAKQSVISVKYKSFRAQRITEILLSPYLLKEFRNRWFVFGTNNENHKIQNLALDRIAGVEKSDKPFIENGNFDTDTFFNDMIGVSRSLEDKPICIRFWANAEQSNYIKTKPL
jgi:predicted DNA-binding transcriptional regulator YafY